MKKYISKSNEFSFYLQIVQRQLVPSQVFISFLKATADFIFLFESCNDWRITMLIAKRHFVRINCALMNNINLFLIINKIHHLIATETKPKNFLRIIQGLKRRWSQLLMNFVLLCDNKGPSAVCHRKFRIA